MGGCLRVGSGGAKDLRDRARAWLHDTPEEEGGQGRDGRTGACLQWRHSLPPTTVKFLFFLVVMSIAGVALYAMRYLRAESEKVIRREPSVYSRLLDAIKRLIG
jgi:hypothetical protein